MSPHPLDDPRRSLEAGLMLVRQFVPAATSVRLEISGGGLEGFRLVDVLTADGPRLSVADPELLSNLNDDAWRYLGHLPWNDVVDENEYGTAHLKVPDTPIPAKSIWTCLICGFFSDQLRADRDRDHLRHDGAHYPNWYLEDEDGSTHD